VSKFAYGLPPILIGNIFGIISFGLVSTFHPGTTTGHWIGYQIIAGAGRGMSLQMPLLVVQSAIPKTEMATGTSILVWCQFLGGSVFLTLAQVVFSSILRSALRQYVPGLDANAAIESGATAFIASVPPEMHDDVLLAYNKAITQTFYLGIGCAAAGTLTCIGIWNSKVEASIGKKKDKDTEGVQEVAEPTKDEAK
jgi:hypothetical protein